MVWNLKNNKKSKIDDCFVYFTFNFIGMYSFKNIDLKRKARKIQLIM